MVLNILELSQMLVKKRILGRRRNNKSMNYEHSLRVYVKLKKYTSDEEILIAGLLHDILEDSDTTSNELRSLWYTQRIITLIEWCTHDKTLKIPDEQ